MNGHGLKLHCRSLDQILGKFIFTERGVKHWKRLPREMVEKSCLEVLKNMWIQHTRIWFNGKHHDGAGLAVGLEELKDPFQPHGFYDSGHT